MWGPKIPWLIPNRPAVDIEENREFNFRVISEDFWRYEDFWTICEDFGGTEIRKKPLTPTRPVCFAAGNNVI